MSPGEDVGGGGGLPELCFVGVLHLDRVEQLPVAQQDTQRQAAGTKPVSPDAKPAMSDAKNPVADPWVVDAAETTAPPVEEIPEEIVEQVMPKAPESAEPDYPVIPDTPEIDPFPNTTPLPTGL